MRLAKSAAFAAVLAFAGATAAEALPIVQQFSNVKIAARAYHDKANAATKYCSGKGFDQMVQYQFSHLEPISGPRQMPKLVYSLIVCMDISPF
jgi:hypothetical protein